MASMLNKVANSSAGRKLREMRWRYIKNFSPTLNYIFSAPSLSDEQKRIVRELRKNGIAISNVDLLFGKTLSDELAKAVADEEKRQEHAISEARNNVEENITNKTFTRELLGESPVLNTDSIYLRIAMHPSVVALTERYFGMKVKLRWLNVWRTFCWNGNPHRSQLWHIDGGDHHLLTFFIYLSDVDAGSGALQYAQSTHPKGKFRYSRPEFFKEPGRNDERSTDEMIEKVVPRENWLQAVGKKGTVVIADNRGYHKGGQATQDERLLFAFFYSSFASAFKDKYQVIKTKL